MKTYEISSEVANLLPASYEPLLLQFGVDLSRQHEEGTDIGTDYGTRLVVSWVSGAVTSVPETPSLPRRFMNSNISALADCLKAHALMLQEHRLDSANQEDRAVIQRFKERIQAADPTALSHTENWWSVIVEQLQHECS